MSSLSLTGRNSKTYRRANHSDDQNQCDPFLHFVEFLSDEPKYINNQP
jgi:hypothetical protein